MNDLRQDVIHSEGEANLHHLRSQDYRETAQNFDVQRAMFVSACRKGVLNERVCMKETQLDLWTRTRKGRACVNTAVNVDSEGRAGRLLSTLGGNRSGREI